MCDCLRQMKLQTAEQALHSGRTTAVCQYLHGRGVYPLAVSMPTPRLANCSGLTVRTCMQQMNTYINMTTPRQSRQHSTKNKPQDPVAAMRHDTVLTYTNMNMLLAGACQGWHVAHAHIYVLYLRISWQPPMLLHQHGTCLQPSCCDTQGCNLRAASAFMTHINVPKPALHTAPHSHSYSQAGHLDT